MLLIRAGVLLGLRSLHFGVFAQHRGLDVLGERFTIEVKLIGFVFLPLFPYSSKRVERVFSEVN